MNKLGDVKQERVERKGGVIAKDCKLGMDGGGIKDGHESWSHHA